MTSAAFDSAIDDLARSRPAQDVHRRTLPNGLRVVVQVDPSRSLTSTNLSFGVGSRNDPPGRTGLSHLFEHLFFQGSRHVAHGELLRSIQQGGGQANGSTWYDLTTFSATLPSHHLETALWLDSDRLGFFLPALTEERLEVQRRVVLNERRKRFENRPYGRAYEHLHELLFPPRHPYRAPVIGYVEDLEAISLDDARELFRTHYAPGNAVLTVVGDVDAQDALDRVAGYFGDLPGRSAPPRPRPLPAENRQARREVVPDEVPLARVYLGFQIPPYPSPAWFAADLVCEILTRGRSSLLYRDLVVERQAAQDVSSFVLPTELVSVFVLVATCKPGVAPEVVEDLLLQHVDRFGRQPADPRHFDRARNRVVTEYYRGLQSSARAAEKMSRATLMFDDPELVQREVRLYAEAGREDVEQCAASHLRPEAATTIVYLPRGA